MEEKDVEVTVSDGVLTIKGEKQIESRDMGADHHLRERRYGSFHRTFRLPDTVDEEKIAATVDKGVLTVTLPKNAKPEKAARHIEVKASK
jgi:HSP20 family protein